MEAAVAAYGLKSLPGSDGQVEVKEKVEDMVKGYKLGEPISFTAVLNLCYDPEKSTTSTTEMDARADAIDVAVEGA